MDKVRVAVVGVGSMGSGHADCIANKVEETELVAVCDINKEVADKRAEEYGVKAFYDHKELLASGLADAITVGTPHYDHPPIAIDAFKAGVHVMSEKPIGVAVKAADEMIAAAKESGLVFCVGYQRRFEPAVQGMKALIDSGRLGKIYRASMVETHFRTQAYYDSAGWRATWKGEGGGVLLNQAPHGIDIFMMLMGLPKSLRAVTRTWGHHIEVEDEASAMLEWDGGAVGYYHTSTNEVPGANLMDICGDKGKLVYTGGKATFYALEQSLGEFNADTTKMWGNPEVTQEPVEVPDIPVQGHAAVIRSMARAILFGEERLSPGEEGILSLEFINAVILSGATGKPVEFPVPRGEYDEFIQEKIRTSTFEKKVREQQATDPKLK